MSVVTVTRTIYAPADLVFTAISDLEHLADHDPAVLSVELLTERWDQVGTRIRETRSMGKRQLHNELEVVERDDRRRHLRMVADTDGTIWDTTMDVRPTEEGCTVTFAMTATGSTWFKRMMNAAMSPLFRRGIAGHLDGLKTRCEAQGRSAMQQSRS